MTRARDERGQATLLMLAVASSLVLGVLLLGSLGQAFGSRGKHQRGVDLAAVSAARAMRDAYPRLFEPAYLEGGGANPRHLDRAGYLALARETAVRVGERNGIRIRPDDVRFDGDDIAPVQVTVSARGEAQLAVGEDGARVPVTAVARAELTPDAGTAATFPAEASGGGYSGPLAYRQGKPMRPDVALAFDRMERAARADGLALIVSSGFRSDAEQAALFAAHPDPKWVARPGTSLHRLGTELDLGPPSAYAWLAANAPRFGFKKRYAWEPWHFGFIRNAGTSSVGFGARGGEGRATRAAQSFVPPRYAPLIARAAQRWNVGAALLAAQLYAESGFNPFARSPAGALGIAQFIPSTAAAYGLRDPFDPAQAIDAQAHLMHDMLRQFASVPLALAAYNAGPGAVASCGCIPPYPETRAYVAKILGLLGGVGDAPVGAGGLEVRLVE